MHKNKVEVDAHIFDSAGKESSMKLKGVVHISKDNFDGGVISSSNIRRTRPVFGVPLDLIHIPKYAIDPDPICIDLTIAFDQGKINAYATRVASSDILDGYYIQSTGELVTENTPTEEIDKWCAHIKAGGRPNLWMRENTSIPNAPRFFYSDGGGALKAYLRLGIASIPVMILAAKPPVDLAQSCFVIGHGGQLKDPVARVESFLACNVKTVPALDKLGSPLLEILHCARERFDALIGQVKIFHTDNESEQLHYHDSVYSTLIRAREAIDGIELLANANLWMSISALQRTLYEIYLSFYVDWLAPEIAYFPLSIAARTDSKTLNLIEKDLVKNYTKHRSPQRAQEFAKRALRFIRWLGQVKNKADFAPIGVALHSKYYDDLSSVVHQDFEQAASHANRFRNNSFEYFESEQREALSNFVSIVSAGIAQLVKNDFSQS